MYRNLPSLSALRAFEAVASTRSFTAAAELLGVTQAAVSRQVRALEELLGVVLVQRLPGGNALTEPGQMLYRPLRDSLDRIEEAVQSVSVWPHRALLTVSVAPFFSSVWLTPRIMHFIHAHPEVDLRIHHSYEPPDYTRERVDLGLNWGDGNWRGVTAEKAMDGHLVAVCAPELADRTPDIGNPETLLGLPLFYEFRIQDWLDWFACSRLDASDRIVATKIDDTHALRRLALEGQGVALLCRSLITDDLTAGRLVQHADIRVDSGSHYFLNFPTDRELSSAARKFRSWVRQTLPAAD